MGKDKKLIYFFLSFAFIIPGGLARAISVIPGQCSVTCQIVITCADNLDFWAYYYPSGLYNNWYKSCASSSPYSDKFLDDVDSHGIWHVVELNTENFPGNYAEAVVQGDFVGSAEFNFVDTATQPLVVHPVATGTITIVKTVINGSRSALSFPLFVNGMPMVSGVTKNFTAPSEVYTVTETGDPNYTITFSGDCDMNGQLNLNPSDNKFCFITNTGPGIAELVPPRIELTNRLDSYSAVSVGSDSVTRLYELRNIGKVPVTDIVISSGTCGNINFISGDINSDSKLDVNELWIYSCSVKAVGTHTNTVMAVGWSEDISTSDIQTDINTVGMMGQNPPLVHLLVDPTSTVSRDSMYTLKYIVTNLGKVPLGNVIVTDDDCSPISNLSGDVNKNSILDLSETWVYTCSDADVIGPDATEIHQHVARAEGSANGLNSVDFSIITIVPEDKVSSPSIAPSSYGFSGLSALGLKEGDVIRAVGLPGQSGSDDNNIYIVNASGYKRLFLSPAIFGFYGHLGGFSKVRNTTTVVRDTMVTSGLFRNCETNDSKVYGLEVTGEDTGILHWINTSGVQALQDDSNFFKKVFCINTSELNWYQKGYNYGSVRDVPVYVNSH